MITSFFYNILAGIIQMITNIINFSTQGFRGQVIGFSDAVGYFMQSVWYWQGVLPIQGMLNLLLFVLSFETFMLFVGVFEWIWHKIPWISAGR